MAALLTASAGAAASGPVYQPPGPPHYPVYTPAEPPSPPGAAAVAAAVPAPPPNGFRIQRVRRFPGKGRATAFVRVFAPGRVIVWGQGIRTVVRGARQPRVVRVPIKPKARLRRQLRRHGKARVQLNVAFRPFGGVARLPRKRSVVLRKKRRRAP